ncbi:MAG: Trk system potassium transporter TrkA [Clostridiales bacterium]|nr:Trk system potassium transporter TrkA [Clostridiales bacterium]
MNIIIVGAGRLGCRLAAGLLDEGHNITVIDRNESIVKKLAENLDVQGVVGSGAIREVLDNAEVKRADLLIATTASDENNILSCFIARRMGARHTIARVRNPEYTKQIGFMRSELGISMLINPDFSAALEICRNIQFPSAIHVETFANGLVDIAEVKIREESVLANLKISNLPQKFKNKIVICAVSRGEDVFIPNGDFTILPGDNVYITSSHKHLGAVVREIRASKMNKSLKDIMIIGGSKIAFYLAALLEEQNKNVIIVEKSPERCEELSDKLDSSTIICGDASDYDFLYEEGAGKMDAVVTLTESDEINILVSLYSTKAQVLKTITKVNSTALLKLLDDFNNDTLINVAEITGDVIIQYIRAKANVNSGEMKSLYKLFDGRVEAAEFILDERTKHIGDSLFDIKFKKDILIASISRKGRFIIPNGDVTLEIGDRIVVVSKGRKIENVNSIFDLF